MYFILSSDIKHLQQKNIKKRIRMGLIIRKFSAVICCRCRKAHCTMLLLQLIYWVLSAVLSTSLTLLVPLTLSVSMLVVNMGF